MSMTVIDVDAKPTAWRECGDAEQVAVLLHGLGGTRIAWGPNLEVLAKTRRVVAWDGPGYGASDRIDRCEFDAYADRAAALIREVSPNAPVDLVGTSFGGMIAQYTTAKYPELVRSLVLLCTSPVFGLNGTSPEEWKAARLAGLEEFGSPGAAAPTILSSLAGPAAAHVVPEAVEAMERIELDAMMDSLGTLVTHDSRSILPTITAPTLVVVGADDDETPPSYSEAIVDLMPNARLQIIAGAGHLLNLEAPEAVNAAIAHHWENA